MNASDFVTMGSGLTLPLDAVRLALDLESRGCHLELDGDGLMIGPRDLLTEDDRVQIRRWRDHLRALIAYANTRQDRTQ